MKKKAQFEKTNSNKLDNVTSRKINEIMKEGKISNCKGGLALLEANFLDDGLIAKPLADQEADTNLISSS